LQHILFYKSSKEKGLTFLSALLFILYIIKSFIV
jgi:hypothetical protein